MYYPQRPVGPKVFEPTSPDYALASSMDAEYIQNASPKVLWWSFNFQANIDNMDELDKVYGEKSSKNGKDIFRDPKEVYCHFEISPIMLELTRLGVEQIEEVILFTNTDEFYNMNGYDPKAGDIFRISYVVSPEKYRNVFYTVGSVIPVDLFNFKYLNWRVLGQQTNMSNANNAMKNYINLL
jgi:hypothetical protein